MKYIISLALALNLCFVSLAADIHIVNTTSGQLATDASAYLTTVTELTVLGTIDARDFNTIKNSMPSLSVLNLQDATITSYTDPVTHTYTPANTLPDFSFESRISLTSVIVPSNLVGIGKNSFQACSGLTGTFFIPNTVTSIGDYAFNNCTGLNGTLTLPPDLTYIGIWAFDGCTALTGSLTIPSKVVTIGDWAFYNCHELTGGLSIPSSVTSIGTGAFNSCSKLSGPLLIPSTVNALGARAFAACPGFTSLTIQPGISTIGDMAFLNCFGLTGSLVIPNTITTIGNEAFRSCSNITSLTISSSDTYIGNSGFRDCIGITTITSLNNTPPSLGSSVFEGETSSKLIVSSVAYDAYTSADQWKDFYTMSSPIPATLSGFSTVVGIASPSKTFTIGVSKSAIKLTIIAPTNYEVREDGTGIFNESITFTSATGDIPTKTIEIRLTSLAPIGSSADNVGIYVGSKSQNLAVSGDVILAPQTIIFAPLPNKTYGDTPLTLTASSSSNLPISYKSSNTAVATISGDVLTIVGAGNTTITASQPGNITYYGAANDVTQLFIVNKKAITIAADTKTKIYGDIDPILTAQVTIGTILGTDVATGSLVRVPGENTGTYSINQGSYTYGSNYNETFVSDNLTIGKREITITADAKAKIYGDTDPAFTAQVTLGIIQGTDAPTGSPTRVSGENVGTYTINKGTYTYGTNYNETFVKENLTITKRSITITADAKTKIYGDTDPAFSATVPSVQFSDLPTGQFSRVAGENTGTYTINKGTYTYGTNYNETFVNENLTIIKRSITITADTKTKIYGDADPAFSATVPGVQFSDLPTGQFSRVAGENIGAYTINKGTYTYGTNYNETFVNDILTITKRSITITADTKTKIYGDTDPAFTAQVTLGIIQGTDAPTGSPTRVSGENVGTYSINQGSYTYGSNYNETFVSDNLTIGKRAITITADAKAKIYGDTDPAFTAQVTLGIIQGTDVPTGSPTRVSGENVGAYTINKGTYTYGTNYNETFVNENLTITKRSITITADAKAKIYGDTDPAFTAQVTLGTIQGTDAPTGSPTRVSGENVGTYTINKGTYTYGTNYNETFVNDILTITKRSITITADSKAKTYGETDPAFSAQVTLGIIQGTDAPTGSPTRVSGENVGTYSINQGSYTYGSNYNETFVSDNLTIGKRAIIITADAKAKTYGETDPAFTAQVTIGIIQGTDAPTGSPTRVSGENVGTYSINQGSYTYGSNYNETFVSDNLTIGKRAITITADAKAKIYGDTDPAFTAQVTLGIIQGTDVPTGSPTRVSGENVGAYTINKGTYTYGTNYNETFVNENLTITKRSITITADAKAKIYGDTDPVFTAQVTLGIIQGTDAPTGSPTRVSGENVGAYTINKGTYTYGTNYNETFVNENLTITKRSITITADAKAKTYGETDPAFSAQVTLGIIQGTDAPTGSPTRVSGENVGTYTINKGTYTYGTNYNETFVNENLTITKRSITITADAKTKIYGDTDPAFSATVASVQFSDLPTGQFSRVAGENTGTYTINKGTYTYGTNYNETFVNENLTIIKRSITITADTKTKIYGDADPAFSATVPGVQFSDLPTGQFSRVAGENIGAYTINKGTYTYGTNYNETFVNDILTITKRSITITADTKTKIYGDTDPAFTAQVTLGIIQGTDAPTGSPTRVSGENVGTYSINQGSYTYGSNYNETFVSDNLTIGKRAITITADAKAKIYGDTDPAFTAQVTLGIIQGTDVPTGSPTRVSGENVGAYTINKGTYTYGTNYNETFVNENLTITKRSITITANAKAKIYGDTDPVFTAQVTLGIIQGTDAPTGSPTRVSGENVGTYSINQGSYTYGSNYNETFVSDNLTIGKRAITITADAKAKIYGDTDPAFTAQVTLGIIQGTDVPTGSPTRVSGENVGTYTINKGTYTYGTNYNETFVNENLTITKRSITITADTKTKIYGDADPAFSATVPGVQFSDLPTGQFSRVAGENIGAYTINKGTYTYGTNYNETFVNDILTITKRSITITADTKTKIYGDTDPAFTAQVTLGIIQGTDAPTGSPTRVSGENVGTYSINQGSYTYGSNYNETFVSDNLTIGKRAITITADAKAKIYGDTDPAFTAQVTLGIIQGTDVPTGSPTRVSGENVGAYTINKGTYTYGTNYNETFVNENLTITKRSITITADAKAKAYGDTDPAFTAQVTSGIIQGTDVPTGSPTRVSGENVGTYTINKGTYTYGTNYNETFVNENLTITKRSITITADAKTKIYGDADPAFSATVPGVQFSDLPTGQFSRVAGENIGAYTINKGTYTYGTNYNETFLNDILTITKRSITITADTKAKIYGDTDPVFTAQVTLGIIQGTDAPTGSPTRVSGENVGTYSINQGSYTYGSNYNETFVSDNLTIGKRAITITADAKAKIYGDTEPVFTAQVTLGIIQGIDAPTGSPTRVSGENVGAYTINKGTYTYGTNYNETFVNENLTITKRSITITADAKTKIYGDTDPAFSATVASVQFSDLPTGQFSRVAGENTGTYTINKGTYTYGTNYNETFVNENLTITKRSITITADAKTKIYGDTDPAFSATVASVQFSDLPTGQFSRVAGENTGTYTINKGTYTYGTNYNETFVNENLTITKRSITITADTKTKIYGDADPAFSATVSGVQFSDLPTGQFSRVAGENIGAYTINKGTYTYGTNYNETFVNDILTITKRSITITADTKTKIYGDTDPAFTAQVTLGTIQGTDAPTGSPTRVSGENVGAYTINKGTYTYGTNYNETFVNENLTITKRSITITANAKAKIYGDTDPAFTAQVTLGIIQGTDAPTGSPTRVSGENVGTYTINKGTYTYGTNYNETFVKENLTITKRSITITADAKTKIYGDTDPAFSATVPSVQFSDLPTGQFSRVAGENTGTYTINKGTYTYGTNYNETFVNENLTIIKRSITITADTKTKIYGDTDPAFSAQVTSGIIQGTDAPTGSLTRISGENVGTYTINKGTYTYGNNYLEFFIPCKLTIDKRIISAIITNELSGCESSTIDLEYRILKGTPKLYKITFDIKANALGIKDVAYKNLPSKLNDGIISFPIPNGTPFGVYRGVLLLKDELDVESDSCSFQFTINISSNYLISKYDDVILIDNSNMLFKSYQWYKNGLMINGATKQFYNDINGMVGSYFAKVTTTSGQTYYTCPKELNSPLKKKSVTVYPTQASSGKKIAIIANGFDESELDGAVLSIYSTQGICIYQSKNIESFYLTKCSIPQIYIGHITLKNGNVYNFKIIGNQNNN